MLIKFSLVAKPCPTLWKPMDCSSLGSSVHGISQTRKLEWVTIFFSRGSSWPRNWTHIYFIGSQFLTTEPPGKPYMLMLLLKNHSNPSSWLPLHLYASVSKCKWFWTNRSEHLPRECEWVATEIHKYNLKRKMDSSDNYRSLISVLQIV